MCVLRVKGDPFDVQGFLASSTFRPWRVYERGRPLFAHRPELCEHTGFSVSVSGAAWTDLPRQCKDAQAFLRRHDADLRRLKELPGVTAELDFPTEADPEDRHITIWGGSFPSRLLWHAGSLGVSLTVTLYFATGPRPDRGRAEPGGTEPEQSPPVGGTEPEQTPHGGTEPEQTPPVL